ncbi:MAG TPA: anaerobic ribonucleoside-triphosphate reductase activating protein [Thermoplasmata archaeon]|nr:anaerobic ribonucleoside-triphosphate reductase activating protein [Thermoplasmata archaeon]
MIEDVTPSASLHNNGVVRSSLSSPSIQVKIKGFLKSSLVDWDGYVTAVVFLPRCNLRCPMCHNHEIVLTPESYPDVPGKEIERYLMENNDFIDGVVITGGEPTIYGDLPDFCRWLKSLGSLIKLDTNGTHPEMIKHLIDEKLIDYIAMDVKAPLHEDVYNVASGCAVDVSSIRRSINVIMSSYVEYEFRTTVVPSFLTAEDVVKIAETVSGAKRFVLQQFNPKNTLDPKLREVEPYSSEELENIANRCKPFVSKVKVRAKK